MGQFSMEISGHAGSVLSGNQHVGLVSLNLQLNYPDSSRAREGEDFPSFGGD
jgi:hypothetical protein